MSCKLIASFYFSKNSASKAKAMHEALSAILHNAKASALCKHECVLKITCSSNSILRQRDHCRKLEVQRGGASLLPKQHQLLLLEEQSSFSSSRQN
jgi:hypothetical protein